MHPSMRNTGAAEGIREISLPPPFQSTDLRKIETFLA